MVASPIRARLTRLPVLHCGELRPLRDHGGTQRKKRAIVLRHAILGALLLLLPAALLSSPASAGPAQAIAMHVKPDLMITHAPGHMFVTDVKDAFYGVL